MSALAAPVPAPAPGPMTAVVPATIRTATVHVQPISTRRVLRSEWVKLRSLRSTAWTLLVAAVLMIGLGWLAGWDINVNRSEHSPEEQAMFSAVDGTLGGFYLAQLAVAVLGVLLVTGEHATGMVRATFAAVPRRLPVLWAKSVLFALVTFTVMLVAATVAFVGGQEFLGEHGTTLGGPGVVRGVVGVSGYLSVVAVLAVAVGFIVRSTAGGVATMCSLLLVAPTAGLLLPASWQEHLLPYLPSRAGAAVFSALPPPDSLSAASGSVVLGVWLVVAVAAAALVLRRRDV